MADALRIGIVGAARVATYAVIAPARNIERVEVAAVASRDRSRAEAYASEHGIGRVHASYDELYADPSIGLVYIATPPSAHAAQALAAIAHAKPVLVEKPFAMSAAEAQMVFDAAQVAGVPVFEAMHSPHHRLFTRVLGLIGSGAIGEVRSLDAEFSVTIKKDAKEFRWRADLGGGALMDLGVYPLAWCRRIAGEIVSVQSASARFENGVDAEFSARLSFGGGVTAEVRSSMMSQERIARLVVTGTKGVLDVINPLAPQLGHALNVTAAGARRTETVDGPSTYDAQLIAVRDAVVDGRPFPYPSEDFVRSMTAIEMVRAQFDR